MLADPSNDGRSDDAKSMSHQEYFVVIPVGLVRSLAALIDQQSTMYRIIWRLRIYYITSIICSQAPVQGRPQRVLRIRWFFAFAEIQLKT